MLALMSRRQTNILHVAQISLNRYTWPLVSENWVSRPNRVQSFRVCLFDEDPRKEVVVIGSLELGIHVNESRDRTN